VPVTIIERFKLSDNSASAVYHGEGQTVSGWRSTARAGQIQLDEADLTATETEGNPHLTGQTPTAAGSPCAAEVPNLSVTKVSNPAKTSGLPSGVAADQSVFTAARPGGGK
jgi:hypothetical protein